MRRRAVLLISSMVAALATVVVILTTGTLEPYANDMQQVSSTTESIDLLQFHEWDWCITKEESTIQEETKIEPDTEYETSYAEEETLETEQETSQIYETEEGIPLYTVNEVELNPEYQRYIWYLMGKWGTTDVYKYWLAEIYQESGYDENACNDEGDYGLCQLRDTYHDYLVEVSGLPAGTDLKTDTMANIYAGTWLFSQCYLENHRCLMSAVEEYYNSGDLAENMQYYMNVSQWYSTIKQVK